METLAVTVARRVLRLLHAQAVLEQEAAPEGALDLLQLEGIQVLRSGSRSPPAGRGQPGSYRGQRPRAIAVVTERPGTVVSKSARGGDYATAHTRSMSIAIVFGCSGSICLKRR